jgi:hypothetical protein
MDLLREAIDGYFTGKKQISLHTGKAGVAHQLCFPPSAIKRIEVFALDHGRRIRTFTEFVAQADATDQEEGGLDGDS